MSDDTAAMIDRWRSASVDGAFEAALVALDEIVAFLESGQRGLDETVAAYEIGTLVANRCESLLSAAELRVSQITTNPAPSRTVRFLANDADDDEKNDEDATDPDSGDEAPF